MYLTGCGITFLIKFFSTSARGLIFARRAAQLKCSSLIKTLLKRTAQGLKAIVRHDIILLYQARPRAQLKIIGKLLEKEEYGVKTSHQMDIFKAN